MKGIIIASFGSIYKEAVETSIGTIESKFVPYIEM